MKNKLLFLVAFVLLFNTVNAQIPVATKKQIIDFYRTTTLVVKEGGMFSEYNSEIEDAMKKYWTVTPYKFISKSELDDYIHSSKYSFLLKSKMRYDAKKATDVEYNILTLMIGYGSAKKAEELPDLCTFPLAYDKNDENKDLFKLPSAVQFMQNHVALTKSNANISKDNVIKFYNKNRTAFSEKTLYVLKSDLSPKVNSLAKIKKIYKGKVKVVSIDEIKKAIEEKDENVVYLHKVGPTMKSAKARCWKLVLAASDAQLFYFDLHKITKKMPDGILASDFKKFKKMNK